MIKVYLNKKRDVIFLFDSYILSIFNFHRDRYFSKLEFCVSAIYFIVEYFIRSRVCDSSSELQFFEKRGRLTYPNKFHDTSPYTYIYMYLYPVDYTDWRKHALIYDGRGKNTPLITRECYFNDLKRNYPNETRIRK